MVDVAGAGDGGAHTLGDGCYYFDFDVAVVDPEAYRVAGDYLLGGFDGVAVEFDVSGFAFGCGLGAGFDESDGPHPGVDSYWLGKEGGVKIGHGFMRNFLLVVFVVDDFLDFAPVEEAGGDADE